MSSEMGSGIVVPLVKFSEHIGDHWAKRVEKAIKWQKMEPYDREKILTGQVEQEGWEEVLRLEGASKSPEHMLAQAISMWASGASDHLSELDDKAPQSMQDLADLMFKLRYLSPMDDEVGEEEWVKVLALWSAAAMDIDEKLGVKPDWGDW